MTSLSKVFLTVAAGAVGVSAHGYVSSWVVDGVAYEGYIVDDFPYDPNPPLVAAWAAYNKDHGPVNSSSYNSEDIICQKDASNAKAHINVKAGSQISIQWTTGWPSSHHGPILDYLAFCDPDCENVDKSTLKFFKIDAVGLISSKNGVPGYWAVDDLIKNGDTWLVEIPSTIAPGPYVLRTEQIALHNAEYSGEAQNYPQCVNLLVSRGGSDKPDGTLATELYKESDPGIFVNIWKTLDTYVMPGPSMYSGGVILAQSSVKPTATGYAIPGSSVKPTTSGHAHPG